MTQIVEMYIAASSLFVVFVVFRNFTVNMEPKTTHTSQNVGEQELCKEKSSLL